MLELAEQRLPACPECRLAQLANGPGLRPESAGSGLLPAVGVGQARPPPAARHERVDVLGDPLRDLAIGCFARVTNVEEARLQDIGQEVREGGEGGVGPEVVVAVDALADSEGERLAVRQEVGESSHGHAGLRVGANCAQRRR